MSASAIEPQSGSRSSAATLPRQTLECAPAFAEQCPDNALFKQLPELMTPSDGGDAQSQRPEPSPYRELEVLPQPMIVPAPLPDGEDILLERHPGDLG